jgi:hypothetical protein
MFKVICTKGRDASFVANEQGPDFDDLKISEK